MSEPAPDVEAILREHLDDQWADPQPLPRSFDAMGHDEQGRD